ncbi:unnamed protein product [Oncorhynchus mykiss]|uniref:Uncharacterized protein n=1 Tax=Oncorhynchus mykiss TaxID=8022 RepID=A0A060WR39_ONCMY|nr:unnamed protein product [Oncorhynchus mykiss]
MQLCEQVDSLKREQSQLEEQLALEIGEKEAILKKLSKQNKNMNKMKRVSQLVTEEFTEISQKLDLEQGLRQHAEVFAHQVLVKQKETQRQSMVLQQSSETSLQLQHALEQVAHISSTLQEIQRYYRNQVEPTECALEESSVLSELQCVRGQLESSEEERRTMDTQLREAQNTVTQLQGEVKQLEDRLKDAEKDLVSEKDNSTPALPPPPPPPLPPPSSSTAVDPLVVLRNKRKESANNIDKNSECSYHVIITHFHPLRRTKINFVNIAFSFVVTCTFYRHFTYMALVFCRCSSYCRDFTFINLTTVIYLIH